MYKILNMCITYFKILNQINMPAVLREIVRGVTINYEASKKMNLDL
jgi:hypothetical protein